MTALFSFFAYLFGLISPTKAKAVKLKVKTKPKAGAKLAPKKARPRHQPTPMTFPEAMRILAALLGQRPTGEAPPRSFSVIFEARGLVPRMVQNYIVALRTAGRTIWWMKDGGDPDVFEQFVLEKAATDHKVWKTGIEGGQPLPVPRSITEALLAETADDLGHDAPRKYPSKKIAPEEMHVGRRMHIFDTKEGCVIYPEVILMSGGLAVRVKDSEATIHRDTIIFSGWDFGDGWVRRRGYNRPAPVDGAIGEHVLQPALPAPAANNLR
ncbi:hypothetical protein [Bradyrhizobium sp. S69]|uniref:hypothetical protein n=1 Tax=Bradyrhizobium sp. S69 TaxID=1641856 RepID=UPI00131E49A6|nr:hypothetical protein [Bradyrhizobium sp. S69]